MDHLPLSEASLLRGTGLLILALAAWLGPIDPTRAADAAKAMDKCIHDVISVPILSREGGLVVPVEINGIPAAAIISPASTLTEVSNIGASSFPKQRWVNVSGFMSDRSVYETTIDSLKVAGASIRRLPALLTDARSSLSINGRPVAMMVGYDILGNYDLLVDPRQDRLLLFKYSGQNCPDVKGIFHDKSFDTDLHAVRINQNIGIDASIDGQPVDMTILLTANASVISQRDARRLGVSDKALSMDEQVRTKAERVRIGYRHQFNSLVVAGYETSHVKIDVDPHVAYNPLGLDFFADKVALFDFPHSRLVFQVLDDASPAHDSLVPQFSGIATKNVHVHVSEGLQP